MDADIKLTMLVKNLVEYSSDQTGERLEVAMNGSDNLILTGWGHVEYVAAAAAALKALRGNVDVCGVSRRRLPELMEEIAERINAIEMGVEELVSDRKQANAIDDAHLKAIAYHDTVEPRLDAIRYQIDKLELIIDDSLWPLPKYRELLFIR